MECEDAARLRFPELFRVQPKMRYKIKEIMGDYYYEMMSVEETISKVFLTPETSDHVIKNQHEIDQYIRDNMNIKMPLDGPLWRVYV